MARRRQLRNLLNEEQLRARLSAEMEPRVTFSFYRYAQIADPQAFRDDCYAAWESLGVLGRVYIAHEGINGQVSVPSSNFPAYRDALYAVDFMDGMRLNIAIEADAPSFLKLKIKVRPKIVADGLNDATFDVTKRGRHLSAPEVNALLEQEGTIVVDMRNHYESEVGYFEGAIRPDIDNFRDLLPAVEEMLTDHREANIVMYCTGGIRCEKASAYYLHRGFPNVAMVDGGIIDYARQCAALGIESKYLGKNFVFDERRGERITEHIVSHCHQCGTPTDRQIDCANVACHLLFVQCPTCAAEYNDCCSTECRDFHALPTEEKAQQRTERVFNGQKYGKAMRASLLEKGVARLE
ncbi:rhodanese-related sulfurtransferase [Neolewinella lacunae]|uniref:tRNA uridine(34) hydroxylase n=1 Tax=Neolewinella lacunae TaxID=1517758 RepID=A0A923T9W0_9BACT|nr:rhodanese-related sulfurtransferase [Neolewinella lacunae]MBC6995488.1 rhodanese-related sulfurtransferase [Neolewinella lacunae]MDN3635076.1 rhodanese-related sulfurtransferase [Neolewinella lacunae]